MPEKKSRRRCPYCGGSKVQKMGTIPTKRRGILQRYKCVNCASYWTRPTGKAVARPERGSKRL